jgi:hypothetical protein
MSSARGPELESVVKIDGHYDARTVVAEETGLCLYQLDPSDRRAFASAAST